jgi:hypothetical protein
MMANSRYHHRRRCMGDYAALMRNCCKMYSKQLLVGAAPSAAAHPTPLYNPAHTLLSRETLQNTLSKLLQVWKPAETMLHNLNRLSHCYSSSISFHSTCSLHI